MRRPHRFDLPYFDSKHIIKLVLLVHGYGIVFDVFRDADRSYWYLFVKHDLLAHQLIPIRDLKTIINTFLPDRCI